MASKVYKLSSTAISVLAGVVAGKVFKKAWKAAPVGGDVPPAPTDEHSRLRTVLPAAAVQGAVTATVKAALNRGSAVGVRRMTGTWPA